MYQRMASMTDHTGGPYGCLLEVCIQLFLRLVWFPPIYDTVPVFYMDWVKNWIVSMKFIDGIQFII
jgi:hypothetical protein